MVWEVGLEPTTPGSTIRCSTIELHQQRIFKLKRTSKMVRPRGFEPLTYGLEVRCSIQLSHGRTLKASGSNDQMVGVRGFEPPTRGSHTRCANRTALHPERRTHTTNNFLKIKFFVWFWSLGNFKLLRSLDFFRHRKSCRYNDISRYRYSGGAKRNPVIPAARKSHFFRRFNSEQVKAGFYRPCNRFGKKKARLHLFGFCLEDRS